MDFRIDTVQADGTRGSYILQTMTILSKRLPLHGHHRAHRLANPSYESAAAQSSYCLSLVRVNPDGLDETFFIVQVRISSNYDAGGANLSVSLC